MNVKISLAALLAAATLCGSAYAHGDEYRGDRWDGHRGWQEQRHDHWRYNYGHNGWRHDHRPPPAYAYGYGYPPPPPPRYVEPAVRIPVPLPPPPHVVLRELLGR